MEIEFELIYKGLDADHSQLDMYDAAHAFLGLQRSLALTTHFVLNGEIITQATALKYAKIFSTPPESGSWKINSKIFIIGAAVWAAGTIDKETILGHLMFSAYDYAIKNTLGFHVDYKKSLLKLYEERMDMNKEQIRSKLDSLTEKCESSFLDMHRPFVKSKTAEEAEIIFKYKKERKPIGGSINEITYARIKEEIRSDIPEEIEGYISSYNMNTYKGRIYVISEERPVPFFLDKKSRTINAIRVITESLQINSINKFDKKAKVRIIAYKIFGISGRIKSLHVVEVK